MTNHHIEIDGITIEIIRKPIKNMHIRIYPPDGKVKVSAPLKLSRQYICNQLEAKRDWLHKQRARLRALPVESEQTIQTGECISFLGKTCILAVIESTHLSPIMLNDHVLQLTVKPNSTIVERERRLNHWYRAQMDVLIPDLIDKWQSIIGVNVATWGIKTMRTRWGSCNTRTRRIWLNFTLIKKPSICLEYVLVHEMVHLLEASHNARFYQLMDKYMPAWREYQQALYTLTD